MKAKEINALRDELARKQAVIEKMEELHAKCMDGSCSCYSDVDGVFPRCNNSTRQSELAEKEIEASDKAIPVEELDGILYFRAALLLASWICLIIGLCSDQVGWFIAAFIGLAVSASFFMRIKSDD